jgi:hypothetical protein
MTTWLKVTLFMAGACAALLCGLAGCDKAPDKVASLPQGQAPVGSGITPTAEDRTLAASREAPPLPDSSRTDPQAEAMRRKNYEWLVAKKKLAAEAALKQMNQSLGTSGGKN